MLTNLLKIVLFPLRLILAIARPIIRLFSKLLVKPISVIYKYANEQIGTGFFDAFYANNKSALLRGDLLQAAKDSWPTERFPTFFRKIPGDLRKSIIVDGRIRGSRRLPINVLPSSAINNELVESAKSAAVRAAAIVFILSFGFIFLTISIAALTPYFGMRMPDFVPKHDYWSANSLMLAKSWFYTKIIFSMFVKTMASAFASLAMLATASIALSSSFAFVTFWGSWRGMIFDAANQEAEPLRSESKESIVRWKHRLEQRELEEQAYLSQLHEIERLAEREDKLITIGIATGHFNFRGLLTGPRQNQKLKVALSDLFQNTIILGGTGSGKTFAVILPIVNQLMGLQRTQDLSLYVTDSKGVLWRDVADLAKKQGRKVQVVGIGENEHGVDLLDGIEPAFAADLITSIMRQTSGGSSGDSFWPDMAHNTIRHVLTCLRAWERTPGGLKYISETGERPYSLVSAYKLALEAHKIDGWMAEIEEDILSTIEQSFSKMAGVAKSDLMSSLRYLRTVWTQMAKDTRSGIESNITNALASFEADVALRARFASGEQADLVLGDCWGSKITCINLPESLGKGGKIVNVFLKTLLFNEAKKRQSKDPNIAKKQQLAFIADEFQTLITADRDGTSDANFPNVSRSTGTFYLVATQGLKGLEQAIGENAMANFMNNMRNKIFLQIEEQATMNFAQQLAGKALRFYSYDDESHESFESKRRESGIDATLLGPAKLSPEIRESAGFWFGFFNAKKYYEFDGLKAKFNVDYSFINQKMFPQPDGNNSAAADKKSAKWRAEDKNAEYMKNGNEVTDVLNASDLVQMGRNNAYCFIYRSGHSRQDIVRLSGV